MISRGKIKPGLEIKPALQVALILPPVLIIKRVAHVNTIRGQTRSRFIFTGGFENLTRPK